MAWVRACGGKDCKHVCVRVPGGVRGKSRPAQEGMCAILSQAIDSVCHVKTQLLDAMDAV